MINPGDLDKRIILVTEEFINGEMNPKKVQVWAQKKSITRIEFYKSYQSGLKPQVTFVIRKNAYKMSLVTDESGEKRFASSVIYENATYNVIRAYETDDIVELTCS